MAPAAERGIRVVTIRTGLVLGGAGGAEGGILAAEVPIFRLGLGASLGNGRQWTSWVALDDEVAVILRAIDDPELRGPVNSTSPNPVRNAELTDAIAQRARAPEQARAARDAPARSRSVAAPPDELLLASQRVLPAKLVGAGYVHAYGDLGDALRAALPARRFSERKTGPTEERCPC